MKLKPAPSRISRRVLLSAAAALPAVSELVDAAAANAQAAAGFLPSWNDGPAKQAIVGFVHATAAGERMLDGTMLNAVLVLMLATSILGPILRERLTLRMRGRATADELTTLRRVP